MNGEGPETLTLSTRPSYNTLPIREDCWSEEATSTLVDAWGERHLELNRGNLRQKHWQEVADTVNARHGAVKKARRTDIQCKNRIDTLKKKYKVEKAKILASNGTLTSQWPFFARLDALVGPTGTKPVSGFSLRSLSRSSARAQSALPLSYRKMPMRQLTAAVPVAPRSKRPAVPSPQVDDSFFRRNYSVAAAAAAAVETDSGSSRSSEESRPRRGGEEVDGVKELAQAIIRFGEIYEKVEGVKQRQMVELEKQRMEFMKSLEFQRMQLFMDWQVQLEKIKRAKRSRTSGWHDFASCMYIMDYCLRLDCFHVLFILQWIQP